MTEETKISDILRTTTENSYKLMLHIANHIDALELEINDLKLRINELENDNGSNI